MKKSLKKILPVILVVMLVGGLAVTGSLAYLTSTDSDVNVMTLGNVAIEQNEYERVTDEKGDPVLGVEGTDFTADYGITQSYKLKTFAQEKPAYPAVYTNAAGEVVWDEFQQLWNGVGAPGSNDLFDDSVKNVVDKFVFVKNTGKSDVYYRTIIAVEVPDGVSEDMIHLNLSGNSRFDYNADRDGVQTAEDSDKFYVTIDGVQYLIYTATHVEALKPGEVSRPSLLQFYLDPKATNEDCAKFGETWDVLVLSQAVQSNGFADAQAALKAGFGKVSDKAAEWFSKALLDHSVDTWDGTADTTWYNTTDTTFVLNSAEQLAGLAKLVDENIHFEGKTIELAVNMDLGKIDDQGESVSFDPIGDDAPFKGTLDGQGHFIANLYQSGWDFGYEWGSYGSIGLFGELEGATVKNLTVKGFDAQIEGGDIGGITGSASGNCVFENITIEDSSFGTYNNGIGGIIGWSGAGSYVFKNITIGSDVVLGGLWGSFDSSIGGVVGQGEPGATYNFKNVDIACRLDAYNDCTASYDYYNYRMCGMIIGRLEETVTIDGSNYPDTSKYDINCSNVTVTYDDWANYHYCRAAGQRAKRVEPGYAYGGVAADYDHSVCTVHHMELIPFDQIFGGDQYGVKGLKTYDGVTVVYNNK